MKIDSQRMSWILSELPKIVEYTSSSVIFIIYTFLQTRFADNLNVENFITKILKNGKEFFERNSAKLSDVELNWLNKSKEDRHMFCLIDYLISGKQYSHTFRFLPMLLADLFNLELRFESGSKKKIFKPLYPVKNTAVLEIKIVKSSHQYLYKVKSQSHIFNLKTISECFTEWNKFTSEYIYDITVKKIYHLFA